MTFAGRSETCVFALRTRSEMFNSENGYKNKVAENAMSNLLGLDIRADTHLKGKRKLRLS
jgi:hypothetical protein